LQSLYFLTFFNNIYRLLGGRKTLLFFPLRACKAKLFRLKKIIIAVNGFSSCGKSTLAKSLAQHFHYAYIDSGAMYRATTLFFLRHQISLEDEAAIREALERIDIQFQREKGVNTTFLNGENVEAEIRDIQVSSNVSEVAAISTVRRSMVRIQRAAGRQKGIVMDGRDIGTVVFPEAELKIFLTASLEERIKRRVLQLRKQGKNISKEDIKKNLQHRDHIDSTRSDSPLLQAKDAVLIDNSNLSEPEQLAMAIALAKQRMTPKNSGDA
jgi:cytidylate kinase